MNRLFRSSAATWALGTVLMGLAALAAFAIPLWYAWNKGGIAALTEHINARVAMQIAGERSLLLTDPGYHPLAGNIGAWPETISSRPGSNAVLAKLPGQSGRTLFVEVTLAGGYHLLVGRDLARLAPIEQRFTWGLVSAVTLLFVVGVLGAFLIRRALLARVSDIDQTVAAIMQGDLHHRLPSGGSDEFATLSRTLNGMLDHIEHLIAGISNVSNSIAHDLRTPLAELRSRLEELALTRPPPAAAFAEIEAAVADVDRVMRMFNALLRLAEIDSGARRSGFVRVDACKVAAEVVEFYEPAAEEKGVVFSFQNGGEAPVAGDPVLLAQALSNLIDNSLKCVAAHGAISVHVGRRADGAVEIAVADDGPGIADADKPKATERFFRGDASRGSPGVGLGLAIVDAVAKLHGGALQLLDNHPGLRALMVLPGR
jgi:signal transduction histidine kinase